MSASPENPEKSVFTGPTSPQGNKRTESWLAPSDGCFYLTSSLISVICGAPGGISFDFPFCRQSCDLGVVCPVT